MSSRFGRRRFGAAVLVALIGLSACSSGDDRSDGSAVPRRDLSGAAEAGFDAAGSVGQVYLTGATAGQELELVADDGTSAATATADDEGALIFRDVPAGSGYRVAAGDGADLVASDELEVTSPDDVPDQSFYDAQDIGPGYGYLETRDGTTLAVTVRLPGPPEEGPYPTLLEYSGYGVADPEAQEPSTQIGGVLGYATVAVNIRGTGCSGGAFEYFETLQATDGYDVVETIAAQDWVAGGRVGMVGLSYSGISQLFVARTQPPHLASIAPLSVIADTVRGTLAPGGILNTGFAMDWADERQRDARPGGQEWAQQRIDEGDETCIANQALRGQTPDVRDLIEEARFWTDELAAPLAPELFVDQIEVPVFLAGAWQDEQTGGYFANMLDDFTGTEEKWFTLINGTHIDALGPAVFGRWMEFLSLYVAREVPEMPPIAPAVLSTLGSQLFDAPVTVPPERFADVDDLDEALARFEADPEVRVLFDNGAGGQPGAPEPGFEVGFEAWPPPDQDPARWYLGADGALVADRPSDTGVDEYVYDPGDAEVTTLAAESAEDAWVALPGYEWPHPEASTALTYETAPLEQPVVMAGTGSVDLWLGSTAEDVDVEVTLTEVRPDGRETYVQTGWLRASHRALHPDATELRPLHLHTEEAAEAIPEGELVSARVELFPFAHAFRPGSRIRLHIDAPGASRPRWEFDALEPGDTATNRIGRGGDRASSVLLPVVADVDVPTSLPACPALRGQPCRDAG